MKDKEIKRFVRKKLKWWIGWTGLGYWKITSRWEEIIMMDHGGYDTAALCTCDWKYQTAEIVISLSKFRDLKKWEIENAIVHELCHIFLNEMREEGIDHEERCATQLAKAFLWVRDSRMNKNDSFQ